MYYITSLAVIEQSVRATHRGGSYRYHDHYDTVMLRFATQQLSQEAMRVQEIGMGMMGAARTELTPEEIVSPGSFCNIVTRLPILRIHSYNL